MLLWAGYYRPTTVAAGIAGDKKVPIVSPLLPAIILLSLVIMFPVSVL